MPEQRFLVWQPVATLPNDRRNVLLYIPNRGVTLSPASIYWQDGKLVFIPGMEPTHWMDIPEPPDTSS